MGTMVFIHVIACLFTVSCYIRFIGSKDSFELKKPTEVGPLKSSTRKVCLKAEPGGETELDDDLPLLWALLQLDDDPPSLLHSIRAVRGQPEDLRFQSNHDQFSCG